MSRLSIHRLFIQSGQLTPRKQTMLPSFKGTCTIQRKRERCKYSSSRKVSVSYVSKCLMIVGSSVVRTAAAQRSSFAIRCSIIFSHTRT